MKRIFKTALLSISSILLIINCDSGIKGSEPSKKPKNIILMIGDGMGLAQIQAAMTKNHGQLNILQFPYVGLQKTYSADDYITDSGASATALACGKKTNNHMIGVNPDGNSIKNIVEYAEENGLSTGLIATSSITHATPAAFIAHQQNRSMYEEIALDFLKTDIDVIIGGGLKYFNNRSDSLDLIDKLKQKGYGVYTDLNSPEIKNQSKVVALTAEDHNKKVIEGRKDYLIKASEIAINVLSKNKNGFFMMIEGSLIDKGCHANDTAYFTNELLDFDHTITYIKEFAKKDGNTLVIVTADHETGGLTMLKGDYKEGNFSYVFANKGKGTYDHTGIMVPVFSYGPGAETFTGVYENTEIFFKMKMLFGF